MWTSHSRQSCTLVLFRSACAGPPGFVAGEPAGGEGAVKPTELAHPKAFGSEGRAKDESLAAKTTRANGGDARLAPGECIDSIRFDSLQRDSWTHPHFGTRLPSSQVRAPEDSVLPTTSSRPCHPVLALRSRTLPNLPAAASIRRNSSKAGGSRISIIGESSPNLPAAATIRLPSKAG